MHNRRRVLFVIGSLDCGGSERQVIGILKNLDRTQFEPHLYLLNRTGDFLSDVPDDVSITAFSDASSPSGWYFPGRIMRQQIAHLTQHLQTLRPDVVYDRAFLLPLVTAPATKRTGIPRVTTIVSDPARALQFSVKRFRHFKRSILKRSCQQATRVIAVSEGVRQAAIEYYALPEHVVETIPNGYAFEEIIQLADEPNPQAASEPNAFHIVSVGRLQHEKDFETLIEATAKVVGTQIEKTIRVSIVGAGPSQAALEQLIVSHDLKSVMQCVGFQSNPYSWMKSADLFCLTSKYEGLPNVLIEAMACGVPVISTDCPHGPNEILCGGELGEIVTVGDIAALAQAIAGVISNPVDARQRASLALASIQERYSMATSVHQLEDLLLEVAIRG